MSMEYRTRIGLPGMKVREARGAEHPHASPAKRAEHPSGQRGRATASEPQCLGQLYLIEVKDG
jgi:hypothetical protein